jgi:diguanylate cyclase (GGDEF)-like protein
MERRSQTWSPRERRARHARYCLSMPSTNSRDTPSPAADRYRILLEASRRLGAKLGPEELHEAIYRETSDAVDAPGFYLALHDQSRDLARVVYFAEDGKGQHVDIAYRGSDSEVITTQKASILAPKTVDGVLMSLGDEDSDPTKSVLVAPLLHNGRVLGAISAQSCDEDHYDTGDLEMLEGLAGVAAGAIYNSQQFAELDRRRREAEQLEEIGRALTSKLDPDQVIGLVISAVSDVLEVDGAAVWLRDPRHISLVRVADSGGDIALPVGLEWELTGELFDDLVDRHEPIVLDDLATSNALPANVAEHLTGGSAVGVPLVLGGRVEGVLTAGSRLARRFSREDIAVLQRLANQACVALGNARLHANLHALSLTDPLTNLPNRRRLQIHLDHEVAAARRGRPMSIAVFDIDRFKHYNDTFGHIAGDEILRAIGSVLAHENRAMNVVARFGGDEFVSVLSETGIEGARRFVERVQKAVAEDETLAKFGISISIGCAEFDAETMASVNDVLRAGDEDMYAEKAGRQEEQSARPGA